MDEYVTANIITYRLGRKVTRGMDRVHCNASTRLSMS